MSAANPFTKVTDWSHDVKAQSRLNQKELDITLPYYKKFHYKPQEITVQDTANIMETLRKVLTPLLKSPQSANSFIQSLIQSDDLTNFYNLQKPFLREIAGVRNLDIPYLQNLWNQYRNKALKLVEKMKSSEMQATTEFDLPTDIPKNETKEQKFKRLRTDLNNEIIPLRKVRGQVLQYVSKQAAEKALADLELSITPDFNDL